MPLPWNNWYHCMGNTYGTWLPGDHRGFRTRHHREHIPYDYKRPPPPGRYERRYNKSKELMTRPPVYLTPTQRQAALDELLKSFEKRHIQVITLSVDRIHFHLLARFPDHNPRHHIGVAKKESSHYLKADGQGATGGVWGTRTQCIPIKDRAHQVKAYEYILAHSKHGAVTWNFKMKSGGIRFSDVTLNTPLSAYPAPARTSWTTGTS